MRITRRTATAVVAAGALALAAGCSTEGESGAEVAETRTYTDASGAEVEIPVEPKSVVTLSEQTLDGALALGLAPVGTTAARGQQTVSSYLADQAADIPVVATPAEADVEAVLAVKPDLILVDSTTAAREQVEELSKLAPTLFVSEAGTDWRTAFTALADILGKSGEAEDQLAAFADDEAAVKEALGDNTSASISVIRWSEDGAGITGKGGPAGLVIEELGLTRPAEQDVVIEGRTPPVSMEQLDTIDADWMFFGALGGLDQAEEFLTTAEAVPAFTNLQVHQNDRIVLVDGSAWNSPGGILAVRTILTDLESNLAA